MSEIYKEYLRCWSVFLQRIEERDLGINGPGPSEFTRRMTEKALDAGTVVSAWPTVWPHVEDVFKAKSESYEQAMQRFVEAVQYAEQAAPTTH